MKRSMALALTTCLALGSCTCMDECMDEQWTYYLTREAAKAGYWSVANPIERPLDCGLENLKGGPEAAVVLAGVVGAVVLGPPIIDTVLLPITLPHDILFAR